MKLLVSQDLSLANGSTGQAEGSDDLPLFEELFNESSLLQVQIPVWEALLNLGHSATYNYNLLMSILSDYKLLNE